MSIKGICFQNLGLIVTNKCNLDCGHCCRGCKNDKDMPKEVIDRVLDQTAAIGNLAVCGGEVTLAVPTLEYIMSQIVNKHIFIDQLTFVTNGTIYSEELLKLLDEFEKYIRYVSREEEKYPAAFTVSCDKYHIEEMIRLGLLEQHVYNVERYKRSGHFIGLQILAEDKKLFREGNACNLDEDLTVPLYQQKYFVSYAGNDSMMDIENGLYNVGPIVTINTEGIVTEADASLENQKTIYNYGNIFNSDLKEIISKRAKVLDPDLWYEECYRESEKYYTYNKL